MNYVSGKLRELRINRHTIESAHSEAGVAPFNVDSSDSGGDFFL